MCCLSKNARLEVLRLGQWRTFSLHYVLHIIVCCLSQNARLEVFPNRNGGGREEVQKVVILLTDGQNNGHKSPEHESSLLRKEGVVIVAIGVGTGFLKSELINIASSEEYVFTTSSFDKLSKIMEDVVKLACMSKNLSLN